MINLGGFGFNTSMISLIKRFYQSLVVNFEHLQVLRQTSSHLASSSPPTSALQQNLFLRFSFIIGAHSGSHMIFHSHFCSCGKRKRALESATKVLIMHVGRHGKDNWIIFHLYLTKNWGFICGLSISQTISPPSPRTMYRDNKAQSHHRVVTDPRPLPKPAMLSKNTHLWEWGSIIHVESTEHVQVNKMPKGKSSPWVLRMDLEPGLEDLGGLSQPSWFCDFIVLFLIFN